MIVAALVPQAELDLETAGRHQPLADQGEDPLPVFRVQEFDEMALDAASQFLRIVAQHAVVGRVAIGFPGRDIPVPQAPVAGLQRQAHAFLGNGQLGGFPGQGLGARRHALLEPAVQGLQLLLGQQPLRLAGLQDVVLLPDQRRPARHAQEQNLQKRGKQQADHAHGPGQPGALLLSIGFVGGDREQPLAVGHVQGCRPFRGIPVPGVRGRRRVPGRGGPVQQAMGAGLAGIGHPERQALRHQAARGDLEHLVDLDHGDRETAHVGNAPDPGQGMFEDGVELKHANPRLFFLHQADGRGDRHPAAGHGPRDGVLADGLGIDIEADRLMVAGQRHDVADDHMKQAMGRRNRLLAAVPVGDAEGPQG